MDVFHSVFQSNMSVSQQTQRHQPRVGILTNSAVNVANYTCAFPAMRSICCGIDISERNVFNALKN